MKKSAILPAAAVVLLLAAGAAPTALAAPERGFSFSVATVTQSASTASGTGSYSSSGSGYGVDYLFPIRPGTTISVFWESSSGNVSGGAEPNTLADYQFYGLQGRYWFESIYMGGHFGWFSETLLPSSAPATRGRGVGFGITVGLETREGYFVNAQSGTATADHRTGEVRVGSTRLNFGFRWK